MTINESIAQYIPEKFRSLYYNDKTDEILYEGIDRIEKYLTAREHGNGVIKLECKDRTGKTWGSADSYYEIAAIVVTSLNNFQIDETRGNMKLDMFVKNINRKFQTLPSEDKERLAELQGFPFLCIVSNTSSIRIFNDPNAYLLREGSIHLLDENKDFPSFKEVFSYNLPLPKTANMIINDFRL